VHDQIEKEKEYRGIDRSVRRVIYGPMSRRRTPQKPLTSGPPPNDGTPLGHLSDADLVKEFTRELARRRAAGGTLDVDAIESFATEVQREMGGETLVAVIEALPPETKTHKPCPKCGALTPVKVRNRVRSILTVAGELRLSRNYHHCKCGTGFYPRDLETRFCFFFVSMDHPYFLQKVATKSDQAQMR